MSIFFFVRVSYVIIKAKRQGTAGKEYWKVSDLDFDILKKANLNNLEIFLLKANLNKKLNWLFMKCCIFYNIINLSTLLLWSFYETCSLTQHTPFYLPKPTETAEGS